MPPLAQAVPLGPGFLHANLVGIVTPATIAIRPVPPFIVRLGAATDLR
jgi:predicted ABC-type sugar transport system permease subunit